MSSISLGQVAGLIAAGVFLVRAIIPLALVYILACALQPEINAVTWSVASRALQASLWPTILSSDSESTRNVSKRVVILSWLILSASILLNIAGIVTPLGLSQASRPSSSVRARFAYAPDLSSFGQGTPQRYNGFSRVCGNFLLFDCPGRTEGWTSASGNNSIFANEQPGVSDPYINSTLPVNLTEAFSSATGDHGSTLTGALDIQYRTWSMARDSGINQTVDRGQPYPVGKFRLLGNIILRNDTVVLEGLVVDAVNGGVGFRNHTMPLGYTEGAEWQEDLTWVQPITTCVPTNITVEYKSGYNEEIDLDAASVIDNGGFVNLPTSFPSPGLRPSQDIDLYEGVQKGAILYDYLVARLLKIKRNATAIGKRFVLPRDDITNDYGKLPSALQLTKINGDMVSAPISVRNNSNDFASPDYIITQADFDEINTICELSGGGDVSSISNVLIKCGVILAPPRPADGNHNPLVFQPNSTYLREVHVCGSTMRASVKKVTFSMNGTASLVNLRVKRIQDKQYESKSALPLWAMERLSRNMSEVLPLWGLVHDRYENDPGLETLRREYFYLPNTLTGLGSPIPADALASTAAFGAAIDSAYSVDLANSISEMGPIYSGNSDFGLYAMWQKLATSPDTASRIVNLIATDVLASYVVGTKSAILPADSQAANGPNVLAQIDVFEARFEYNMLYAIPAVAALAFMTVAILVALFFSITRKGMIDRLRQYLNRGSPGRLWTDIMHPELCSNNASTKEWNKAAGRTLLTPLPRDTAISEVELKDTISVPVLEPDTPVVSAQVPSNISLQGLRLYDYQTDGGSDVLEPPEADRP